MINPVSSALRSISFGGLPPVRPALQQRPQEVNTQLRSLPAITPTLGPADTMKPEERAFVLGAALGNQFWARKAIEQASEVSYSQAV